MSGQFDPQTQRMVPPWVVYQQAGQLFEIQDLGTSFDAVPDDIGLLWIVQPKGLSSATQYAIDQFIMRGGKALIFVDPVAAVDAMPTEGMPQGMPPVGQASDLPLLFEAWGLTFDAQQVVTDAQLALTIGSPVTGMPIRHYGYLGISGDSIASNDIVTGDLTSINVAMTGQFGAAEESTLNLQPLLTSSTSSSTLPAARFAFMPDPAAIQDEFAPGGEIRIVAARISGSLESAFPNGAPVTTPDSSADTPAGEASSHLAESIEPVNLIVVADVDMLGDGLWVNVVQNFFGQQIANAFASNGAFAVNALEEFSR